ncbi:QPCTL protein, partial [Hirundo rustica]|nr:QPCTL protein [Hirundo rustica]
QSLLVLLDLLGGPGPAIHSHFAQSHHWFLRLASIGGTSGTAGGHRGTLGTLGTLGTAGTLGTQGGQRWGHGVPVLHVIPTPFPWVWHTPWDTEDNLHPPTVQDLAKILVVFVAEFLQL